MAVCARNGAIPGHSRVVIKTKTQRNFPLINGQLFRDRLERFIAMLRGGISAGVVALALVLNPVEYLNTFAVANAAGLVQRDVSRRRHRLMLHNPLNLV